MTTSVVVLGTGYVGLSLCHAASRAGLSVTGYDRDERVVAQLSAGRSHIDDVTDMDLAWMLRAGFRATTDEAVLDAADVAVICVPTPLAEAGRPDLTAVREASHSVARRLHPGMLVILESTTYPGTTDQMVRPILEETGLVAGVDFHLAYSPERVDPGSREFQVRNTPKVVGGLTPACTRRATEFYGAFVETVVPTSGTREAETAKLLENTYRHVNIALVNEMARFCHELGIDVWEAIRAASTKPFGFQAFYPGPGVGGHCIPVDPNYLNHHVRSRLGYPFRFVELAEEVNATMPAYVARRAQDLLNEAGVPVNGATVLLLGVSYKENVSDCRGTPAVPVARQLHRWGATVAWHDPRVRSLPVPGVDLVRVDDLDSAVTAADLVVLLQNHREYDPDTLAVKSRRFFDTRGVTTCGQAHRL